MTLLKLIGAAWLALGLWILWRTIAALSRAREAIQPTGSPLVSGQVLSVVAVFILPGLLALVLGAWLSSRQLS